MGFLNFLGLGPKHKTLNPKFCLGSGSGSDTSSLWACNQGSACGDRSVKSVPRPSAYHPFDPKYSYV